MLNQNYLKVFINGSGSVTIASGHGDPADFQSLEIQTLTILQEDLLTLSSMLVQLSDDIDEEDRNA